MTRDQAAFFRGTLLPIIRETAEDQEEPGEEPNPLRPQLRILLGYVDYLAADKLDVRP